MHFLIAAYLSLQYCIIHCHDAMYVIESEEESYENMTLNSPKPMSVDSIDYINLESTHNRNMYQVPSKNIASKVPN